jgi:hypothetical protein
VPQKAIGLPAIIAVASDPAIHEAQIAVIISHAIALGFRVWLLSRGAKHEEFRHV